VKEDQAEEKNQEPTSKGAFADFSFQFSAAREFQKVEKKIFNLLCSIAVKNSSENKKQGILVVLGNFDNKKDSIVYGMRQIGVNPIQKYINVSNNSFEKEIKKLFDQNYDGAIIINRSGQIIGAKVYLTVQNPALDVPEGCGTRHISAASFSMREDVMAVFTLSEETHVVRIWKSGSFVEQYTPDEEGNGEPKAQEVR